jgi:tRNA A-37 threonylcarbamoyl transferase component Bud32
LPKLKVAADWRAPIERNRYEVAWIETAGRIVPDAVPRILGQDSASGLFAMAYLDPAHYPVWKEQLRDGHVDAAFAAEVGRRIAAIHSATAGDAAVASHFATDSIFHWIRLEPYIEATAAKHPELRDCLMALSRQTLATKKALVHGDVSPKNILAGLRGPVFLDAECAWYGDPAFDLAFCLNHLLLKCIWNRAVMPALLSAFDTLAAAYLAGVDWEPAAEIPWLAGFNGDRSAFGLASSCRIQERCSALRRLGRLSRRRADFRIVPKADNQATPLRAASRAALVPMLFRRAAACAQLQGVRNCSDRLCGNIGPPAYVGTADARNERN